MELLLFLTALLSGLTGVISGERVATPSSLERSSAQAAEMAEELAEAAVQSPLARAAFPVAAPVAVAPCFAVLTAPRLDPFRISEVWLE